MYNPYMMELECFVIQNPGLYVFICTLEDPFPLPFLYTSPCLHPQENMV